MIRLALPLIGRGGWTGGYTYLKNTLRLISGRLADAIEPWVFLSAQEEASFGAELADINPGRVVVDPTMTSAGRGDSLARALMFGQDHALAGLFRRHRIDVALEVASFYGAQFPIPVIAWVTDLQHRALPNLFTPLNWWRREIGFRVQFGAGRTIMLSSQNARDDLAKHYSGVAGQSHVVPFAIDLDISRHLGRGEELRAIYGLPERFLFLPNQFWKHKNHPIVVAALAQLKAQGSLDLVPPVILSGQNKDVRNPTYFDDLLRSAAQAGVESHFRYLGLIPYKHVLALVGSCERVINPSLFEGWSTPIEEAKALGAPLLLSDIAIHREQAPDAAFFEPHAAAGLAAALIEVARKPVTPRAPINALVAAQSQRLDRHAQSLLATIEAALVKSMRSQP